MNQEAIRVNISPVLLKTCEPYLNKYFGISYGYFELEITTLKSFMKCKTEIGESPTIKALETDEEIQFYHHIPLNEFCELFYIFEEEDDNDIDLISTLWFLAYVIMENNYNWMEKEEDVIYYRTYDMVREDLLNLYIFQKSHNPKTYEGQKIIIKHSKGNIPINNYVNWFTKNLLKDYLNTYLADITSIEQAEQELLKYKKLHGRKIKDIRIHIIMYGIYRMFNENKKMKSPKSDALCDFIISYLEFIGIKEADNLDRQWIRAQISYLDSKSSPPLFPPQGIFQTVSTDKLKESGKRLY